MLGVKGERVSAPLNKRKAFSSPLIIKPLKGGQRVQPIRNVNSEKEGKLFAHPYSNIWLSARKHSGKTSLIFHMLKKLRTKHSIVCIFCPTHSKDPAYKEIKKYLDDKGNTYFCYYGLMDPMDEDNPKSPPALPEWIEYLKQQQDDSSDEETEEDIIYKAQSAHMRKLMDICTGRAAEKEKKKKKPPKPNYIFIMDDLGTETRNPMLANLLKKNRHFLLNNIVSSQFATDLDPQTIAQCDVVFLSKGTNDEKLKHVYDKLDLPIEFETFKSIYDTATEEPYSFLNTDVRNAKYYRTFENEIIPGGTT